MQHDLDRRSAGLLDLIARALVITFLAAVGLVGCGGPAAVSPSATPPASAAMTVSPDNPVVVAATATANESEPVLGPADVQVLETVGKGKNGRVSIVPANGDPPVQMSLTPRRSSGQVEHGPRRGELLQANIDAVQVLLRKQAATGPFDLLNTMSTTSRATPGPATLILLSSGLSTSGGMDMRQVLWGADPTSVAAQLKERGLLPSLRGWTVVLSDLGATAPPQPKLPLPQMTALANYWLAICRATEARSCSVNTEPRSAGRSHSTVPVPVIPVPEVTSVVGPNQVTTTTLPADALFAYDSAEISPAARGVLTALGDTIRSKNLLADITGYASPDGGTPSYNRELSRQRAVAVRDALLALGVPADQVRSTAGLGTDADPPDAGRTGGQIDPAKCARLRRVVVVTHPSPDAANS